MITALFLMGAIPLVLLRWKLNVLYLGEEEAKALGIDTSRIISHALFTILETKEKHH